MSLATGCLEPAARLAARGGGGRSTALPHIPFRPLPETGGWVSDTQVACKDPFRVNVPCGRQ